MPTATIYKAQSEQNHGQNPLPPTVRTPSGIALVEIQGTINMGDQPLTSGSVADLGDYEHRINPFERRLLGKFDFGNIQNGEVVMDIDDHQRLRGKISKLAKPLAVLEFNQGDQDEHIATQQVERVKHISHDNSADITIPVLEVITHKIVFASRPEPIVYLNSKS